MQASPLSLIRRSARRPGGARGSGLSGVAWATAIAVAGVLAFSFGPSRPVPAGVMVYGLVTGSTYALLAAGLVMVHRANRVVNFALAEVGVFGAVLAENLARASHWPWGVAAPLGVAAACVVSAGLERLVVQRFFRAPRLVVSVVTIGLAQVVVFGELALDKAFGAFPASAALRTPLSGLRFSLGGFSYDGNEVLLLAVLPVAVGALAVFLRRTNLGAAIRASADNLSRASSLGLPVRHLSTLAWGIAGLFAGLAIVLRSPVVGLVSGTTVAGPDLLLRALAAAVLARFENMGVAIAAGLYIGVMDQSLYYAFGGSTVSDGILVAVIVLAFLLQRRRSGRSEDPDVSSWTMAEPERAQLTLPEWRPMARRAARACAILLCLAVVLLVPIGLAQSDVYMASAVVITAIVALSLVAVTGWCGHVSLGQLGIAAVGAAVTARLSADLHWDFFISLAVGACAGAAVSMLLGLAAFRIRGFFFAVTTLGFGVAVETYFLNGHFFSFLLPTNRPVRPTLFGNLGLTGEHAFFYFCLVVLAIVAYSIVRMRRTRTGRVLIAMRDNERAAESFGISRARAQMLGFAAAGLIAGIGGGLLVVHDQALSPADFTPAASIVIFSMAVIGGIGSVWGVLLGTAVVQTAVLLLPAEWSPLATGVGLVIVLLLAPGGLASVVRRAGELLLDPLHAQLAWARMRGRSREVVPPGDEPHPEELTTAGSPAASESQAGVLLSCSGIEAGYGSVQVLFGVDLDVREGEVLGLLGTNGAGKSTLLSAINGELTPSAGSVHFGGQDITRTDAVRTAALRVGTVPGGRGIFPSLSVAENLKVAAWLDRSDPTRVKERTRAVLDMFPVLAGRLHQRGDSLSGGEQQMLNLAQAFIGRPRLLLVDELSLGLAPILASQLIASLQAFVREGSTVVLVEQSVDLALRVCRRAVFLEKGEVCFDGPAQELLDRPDLLRSVFFGASAAEGGDGGEPPEQVRPGPARPREAVSTVAEVAGRTVLEAVELSKSFGGLSAVQGVSIALHAGEMLGLIGPNGAGKTTLFDMLSGFITPDSGHVMLEGVEVTGWLAERRARRGIGRSFQNAKLFPSLSVTEAIKVSCDGSLAVRDPLSSILWLPVARECEADLGRRVNEVMEMTGLEPHRDKLVSELSTGMRRIVEMACALARSPAVLLLDEPSTGISQHESEALAGLLTWLRDETRASFLLIEHDMGLVAAVADRVVALDAGRQVACGSPREVLSHAAVRASYLGGGEAVAPSLSGADPGRHA